MGLLTPKERKALPDSKFGLPDERKYPQQDRSHAANSKARAAGQVKKGNLSKAKEAQIDARADRVLGKGKKK